MLIPRTALSVLAALVVSTAAGSHQHPPQHQRNHAQQRRSEANAPFHWSSHHRLPATAAGVSGEAVAYLPHAGTTDKQTPTLNFELNRPAPLMLLRTSVSCTLELISHSFTNSYGRPAIVTFSPSAFDDDRCKVPAAWTGLSMTIRGTSIGRQFDRLGTVWLGNDQVGPGVEVWRTDNPEPTSIGIEWQTSKDIGRYYSLLKGQSTSVLFDFPNIVDDTYTGALNLTLSISAFVDITGKGLAPLSQRTPDLILPISEQKSHDNSLFRVGGTSKNGTVSLRIPHNAARATVELYATGTATEEFWYTLVPDKFFRQLINATDQGYYGHGPYREVQLHIDGQLAGLAAPYPVIYTGGVQPLLWRPSASFGAFDSPTYSIDVTPFLGGLTDGRPHEFSVSVASGEADGRINNASWFVSGNVAVYLDSSDERTTGKVHAAQISDIPRVSVTGRLQGDPFQDGKLTFTTQLAGSRTVEIRGSLSTGSDRKRGLAAKTVVWQQSTAYENRGVLTPTEQTNVQRSTGWTRSTVIDSVEASHNDDEETIDRRGVDSNDQRPFRADSTFPGSGQSKESLEMSFSYPLTVSTVLQQEPSGNVTQRSNIKGSFVRRINRAGASTPARLLIGNEDVLGRHAGGGDWNIEEHRDTSVFSTLKNENAPPAYSYESTETLVYQDVSGNGFDRTTKTRDCRVVSDDLSGSLSDRAQPLRLGMSS